MTNDEAVQWCSDNNVRVTDLPGNVPKVQGHAPIPSSFGAPLWASKIRTSLVEVVLALQQDLAAVASGSKSVSDRSLVDMKTPDQAPEALDPSLVDARLSVGS